MTVIYNMSIDRADKPWIGDRRLTEIRHQPAACERASRASDADARSLAQRSFCYGTHARSHARWGVAYIHTSDTVRIGTAAGGAGITSARVSLEI